MRKFNVNVNGQNYVVEVEEVSAGIPAPAPAPVAAPAPAPVAPAPVAAPTPAPAPAPAAPAVAAPADGVKLASPMPGTINDVKVATGAAVKKGQTLFILEAMKMENDIVSPADGTVTVTVSKGASVNSGDLLAVIK